MLLNFIWVFSLKVQLGNENHLDIVFLDYNLDSKHECRRKGAKQEVQETDKRKSKIIREKRNPRGRRRIEERCGPFLLKRVQRGSEKLQTADPNGFSLFVMRLLLPKRAASSGGWGLDEEWGGLRDEREAEE